MSRPAGAGVILAGTLPVLLLLPFPVGSAAAARIGGHISGGPPPVIDRAPDGYGKFRRGETWETPAPHPLIVILDPLSGATPPPPPAEHPVMNQRNERFAPRALAVSTGTTVDFLNSDSFYHNVFSLSSIRRFDLGRYRKGLSRSVTFSRPGLVKLFCDIHPNMIGYILVTDSPYFASMTPGSTFEISGVPEGSYRVRVWHERLNEPIELTTISVGVEDQLDLNLTVPS